MRRILTYIFLLFAALIWAQQGTTVATGLPYECSFEATEDLSSWVLNAGASASAKDKWIFGSTVRSSGRRSMYVTTDGQNPGYGRKKNVLVSYLRYKFPQGKNSYDISFDWKGAGQDSISCLYVMTCPEEELTKSGSPYNLSNLLNAPGAKLSNTQLGKCQILALGDSASKYLSGGNAWQNVSLVTPVSVSAANSAKNFVFLFVWVNQNSQALDTIPKSSIAIDNFQVNLAKISKPTNVQVYPHCEDSTLLVTWESNQSEFDIQYRKLGELDWLHGVQGIGSSTSSGFDRDGNKCSFYLPKILEGTYDIRIRSSYYDEEEGKKYVSNYVYVSQILVYCPDNHCVNYVNLYGPNVTCTYGMNPDAYSGQTPYDNIGIIDFGPESEESRHTIHVDPNEVDPRTDSLLKTVPDGALASVRLGNWKWGGEAESITYDVYVDSTTQGILIVKYAIVFENPPNHSDADQPRFDLKILDENGNMIDQTCGHAEFTYESGVAAGWNVTRNNDAAWKDWTTIGVNLMPYHGQHIKVCFTTMDCGAMGHYAYAYFTVDCANAHIETENCGSDPHVTCMAPEGFAYAWYNQNGDTVSHDQTFVVEASRQIYTCRVSFIEQPDCYFEISTTSEPRFPVPDYSFERVFEKCRSKIVFSDSSHVMNKFDGEEHHTSERCNETRWRFRSLVTGRTKEMTTSSRSVTYECREYGDSIEVTQTAFIGVDNTCEESRTDTIVMPNIVPTPTEFRYKSCEGEPFEFGGEYFDKDTVYTKHFDTEWGCDSTSTLYLSVYPKPKDQYRHDSICSNQNVVINGIKYNQPLENYLITLKNENGCDSAIYLTLTVNQLIQADVETPAYACADEEQMYVVFNITEGVYDSLRIHFNSPQFRDTMLYNNELSVAIPYPANILPGQYSATMTFYQFCCGTYVQTRNFDVRYQSSIVEQKWNDVLTLLSPQYNGGYEFTAYQWYKNDIPLLGENKSYLYQPLDFDAEYCVEVTRKDGTTMKTCPIQPTYHEQQSEYPTIVTVGQRMPMYMEQSATVWYYTVSGQLYSTCTLPQGYTELEMPNQAGVYILKSVNAKGETQAQVMLVQ